MKALFDGDILVFRCGFAAERATWFLRVKDKPTEEFSYKKEADARLDELLPGKYSREEGKDYSLWSERYVEPVENALHLVNGTISSAVAELDLTEWDITVFLSGDANFRYDVAKTRPYKGNRDKAHRPTHEEAIKAHIKAKWPTVVSDGCEADDELGIHQCEIGPLDSVIVTQDKDLDMIPGLKYDFVQKEPYSVTEEQAMYNFYHQLLMGDTTDNIPGLPGIGAAKAHKALKGVRSEELFSVVCSMYEAHTPPKVDWYEYMTEQGQLLWIQRKRGEIWTPPEIPQEISQELSLL